MVAPRKEGALALLPRWYAALERRQLADLTFAEVRRGAEALSQAYVQRGRKVAGGKALDGRGKRAAFALLYAPLHFVVVAHAVEQLAATPHPRILDVGCGTGVCSAAWALCAGRPPPRLDGLDTHPWALGEARHNWRDLGLTGSAKRGDAAGVWPGPMSGTSIVVGFVLNELPDAVREAVVHKLLAAHAAGAQVLIFEPVARGVAPFWPALEASVQARGGISCEHRIPAVLPERLALLRRASKRAAPELTARSLWLP